MRQIAFRRAPARNGFTALARVRRAAFFVVGISVFASCGGADSESVSGLRCKSGDFYLDGKEFSDCSQCPSADCGFDEDADQTCTYPNGVQHCTVVSGTVVARCAGQTATIVIANGQYSCGS
jgi:hypothetical protein